MRAKDTTSPLAFIKGVGLSRADIARFWSKVNKDGPIPEHRPDLGPCWLWMGSKIRGYGQFSIGSRTDDTRGHARAPRVAWVLTHGSINDALQVDHLCRNTACVNPAHLEDVTPRVNVLRGDTITARNVAKTHCPQGHPYDKISPNGRHRTCRICLAENARRFNQRQREKQKAKE